jgi:hypothetical protein
MPGKIESPNDDKPPAIFAGYPGDMWSTLAVQSSRMLLGESARGAAIVTRAYMEAFLEDCLQFWSSDKPQYSAKYSKVRHFGLQQKIDDCKKHQLVHPTTYEQMRLIKDIGDKFAHNFTIASFDDPRVAPLVAQLLPTTYTAPMVESLSGGTTALGVALMYIIINAGDWAGMTKEYEDQARKALPGEW